MLNSNDTYCVEAGFKPKISAVVFAQYYRSIMRGKCFLHISVNDVTVTESDSKEQNLSVIACILAAASHLVQIS